MIGIEEDPKYLQLFEMEQFGSPADYFDWRKSLVGFGSLLDVHGLPISKSHENFNTYHNFLSQTETALKMRTRRWGNRFRK